MVRPRLFLSILLIGVVLTLLQLRGSFFHGSDLTALLSNNPNSQTTVSGQSVPGSYQGGNEPRTDGAITPRSVEAVAEPVESSIAGAGDGSNPIQGSNSAQSVIGLLFRMLSLGLVIIFTAAHFLPRLSHDTGKRLVTLKRPAPAQLIAQVAPLLLFDLFMVSFGPTDSLTFALLLLGDALLAWMLWSGVQLREHGILRPGAFIPWASVSSYGWGWQDGATLVIDADLPFAIFGRHREVVVPVPSDVRGEVDRILDQELLGRMSTPGEAQIRLTDYQRLRNHQRRISALNSSLTITVVVLAVGSAIFAILFQLVVLPRIRAAEQNGTLPPVQFVSLPVTQSR